MFDHLSGERREFFDPLMPHKLISNTKLMSAQVTDAIALPVVNCAFLRSGDYLTGTPIPGSPTAASKPRHLTPAGSWCASSAQSPTNAA